MFALLFVSNILHLLFFFCLYHFIQVIFIYLNIFLYSSWPNLTSFRSFDFYLFKTFANSCLFISFITFVYTFNSMKYLSSINRHEKIRWFDRQVLFINCIIRLLIFISPFKFKRILVLRDHFYSNFSFLKIPFPKINYLQSVFFVNTFSISNIEYSYKLHTFLKKNMNSTHKLWNLKLYPERINTIHIPFCKKSTICRIKNKCQNWNFIYSWHII